MHSLSPETIVRDLDAGNVGDRGHPARRTFEPDAGSADDGPTRRKRIKPFGQSFGRPVLYFYVFAPSGE